MNTNLTEVESSQIAAMGHVGTVLTIKFKKGGVYEYANVSDDDYAGLKNAPSIGSYFSKVIKKNPQHPCTKVGD